MIAKTIKILTRRRPSKIGKRKGALVVSRAVAIKTSVPRLFARAKDPSPRALGGVMSQLPSNAHSQLCGQLDPFCPHSIGAKVASEATGALTATIQEKVYIPLLTDANGNVAYLLNNGMANSYSTVSQLANGNINNIPGYVNNQIYTSLGGTTATAEYRIVTWGFTFNYTGSDYNNQGVKCAMRIPTTSLTQLSTDLIGVNPFTLRTYLPESHLSRLPTPLIYIGRPQTQMSHEEFVPVQPSDAADSENNPWGAVVLFAISGAAASSTVGYLELIINYEVQQGLYGVATTTLFTKVQNPIPGPSSVIADLAGRVRTGLLLFYDNLPIEIVTQRIANAAASILTRGAGSTAKRIMNM